MMEIEKPCNFDQNPNLEERTLKICEATREQAYETYQGMARVAQYLMTEKAQTCCILPFCHTLEAENLGGKVKKADATSGPRIVEAAYERVSDLLEKRLDFQKGRLKELLKACQLIKSMELPLVVEVTGPITILSGLVDMTVLFRTIRKEPELVKELMGILKVELLEYIMKLKETGVDIISFADPAGATSIVGPKVSAFVVENFTEDFLRKATEICSGTTCLSLCPKVTFALERQGKLVEEDYCLPEAKTYQEVLLAHREDLPLTGTYCIKNDKLKLTTIEKLKLGEKA